MEVEIESMGMVPFQGLQKTGFITVSGVTSRGVFLQGESGWVGFLSAEGFHGPLTLNLGRGKDRLRALAQGMSGEVSRGSLAFPAAGLVIGFGRAKLWEAPAAPCEAVSVPAAREGLLELARLVLVRRGQANQEDLLRQAVQEAQEPATRPYTALQQIGRAVYRGNAAALIPALEPFYGLGQGLTPSGDDLIAGLLLGMNRWGSCLSTSTWDMAALNRATSQAARGKTTHLSAALIECAAAGQGDERLILALDGALTGGLGLEDCAGYILGWGSSSGSDALAGMVLALL